VTLTSALHRITARTYTVAFLGNALLLVFAWIWLYIPDAHIWQFLFTVLFGAAILAGFLALHVTIVRRLYPAPQRPLWQSALVLFGWLLLAYALLHLASPSLNKIEMRAGYWNSQLSPHRRAFFTYQRLIDWQNLAFNVLFRVVLPAILLPFAIETVQHTAKPWRTAFFTLRRWQLWLTVLLAEVAGTWLTSHILNWHPLYSVRGEIVSVALRTLLAYALAIALLLLTIDVVAELLSRQHARRNPTP
jgi:hypothetical protein